MRVGIEPRGAFSTLRGTSTKNARICGVFTVSGAARFKGNRMKQPPAERWDFSAQQSTRITHSIWARRPSGAMDAPFCLAVYKAPSFDLTRAPREGQRKPKKEEK